MSKKTLTLQITKKNFDLIKSGEQKKETREIREATKNRYLVFDEAGEYVDIRDYDVMQLINGRKSDAPRLEVEIKSILLVECLNEDKTPVTYEENGKTLYLYLIEYELGAVTVLN